jgi:glycerol-3-phosphate dehydrogenase
MPESCYDIAVIGAGVVGAAIARDASLHDVSVALIEAGGDVGAGTSKANTAIWHTGFDSKPGTLESRLLRRGTELLDAFVEQAGVPARRIGALLVAWNDAELEALEGIRRNAEAVGYDRIRRVAVDQLSDLEPDLGPGGLGGLLVPDEAVICPFTMPLALATQAVSNGAALLLDHPVVRVDEDGDAYRLGLGGSALSAVRARYVVNAAGLHSDEIDRLFGHDGFTVRPRRGELIVFDKFAARLVRHILLPVPTKMGKGVLVSPTVFGNVMLGPTAEDLDNKEATETSAAGLGFLWGKGERIVPRLTGEEVTATYAGLRAATEHDDYQILAHPAQRYVCVGGIRSTGLSACLGIAEHVIGLLRDCGLEMTAKETVFPVRMPSIGEAGMRPYQDAGAIAADSRDGRIVCHCERVSEGEIVRACHTPIPARTMDGLRRRTRAGLGRCQGFCCSARVVDLLARESGQAPARLLGLEERP